MAGAGQERNGTMAAVLGMDDEEVERICADVSDGDSSVVEAANFNSPGQVVISGDVDAVERAMERARNSGAKRVVPLPVSGAFHSPLMEYAKEGLTAVLAEVDISEPSYPVYLNVTAQPTTNPQEIRHRLVDQLTAPVRWSQTLRAMQADGASRFIEVGAGSVLSGLVRRTLGRDFETMSADKASDLADLVGQDA